MAAFLPLEQYRGGTYTDDIEPSTVLHQPIRQLAADLAAGVVTARELIETAIAEIENPAGEGSTTFVSVASDRARSEADAIDRSRSNGTDPGPFAGIPVAVKDLADIEGEVTTAGSTALADHEPAKKDATAVQRLRDAGFVVIGRTNMTEFAFSGLGLNPHYGTPRSPWDRQAGRIPGGSSSGTAVAVADGMAAIGLGTDTGGSCRIPAAFCNIVGYKPTARRVPLDGIFPLSPSLDSVGPLSNSVDCAAIADAVMAADAIPPSLLSRGSDPAQIRLGLVTNAMLGDLDDLVASRFAAALSALSAAGVSISEIRFDELDELPHINRDGGLAPAEALAYHQQLIADKGDMYDQRVRRRIDGGATASAVYYLEVQEHRRRLVAKMGEWQYQFDALIAPTVAIVPPTLDSFPLDGHPSDPDDRYYSTTNFKALRNTSIGNFLDTCAISLPLCPPNARSAAPAVGFMLMASGGSDSQLLATAAALAPTCAGVSAA